VYGADVPAPIWRETMTEALQGVPEHGFTAPGGGFFRKGSGEEEDDKDKKDKDKDKKGGDKPGKDDAAGDEPPDTDWLFPP
jgi:membrane carboxypeptidase/penicillin-binding protein